jgi:arylsulfatase A-like enzyme
LCAAFADEVIRFLKEPRETGPFFCYVPFDAPHDPHLVPPDFPVTYDPAKIPLPPNFLPQHPFDNGEMSVRDEKLLPTPRPPEGVRKMNAEYYRYITFLDVQIGRILDALETSPYSTNTIVVFSADSGVARGSHGLIGKQNLYEYDSVRVPLIMAGPGIPAGQTTDAMCYLYDVLPTLGARCRVPAPPKSEGLELNAVLRGGAGSRESLVFAYRGVQRAIATLEWKLIRYPKVNQVQLYNLRDDPYEIHNLADKPEYAARVAELSARLTKELTAAGDKQP